MDTKLLDIEKDHIDLLMDFHDIMVSKQLILVYEGEVNQNIVKAFSAMTERNLEETETDTNVKKRVYHVMVECLQNICKHADDPQTGVPANPGKGIFMVGLDNDAYYIATGNVVATDKVEELKSVLSQINTLDKDEIKELYKKKIKESRLSDKGGAGLGFIDMVKKTGNPLGFAFRQLNDVTSFFVLKTTVSRNPEA